MHLNLRWPDPSHDSNETKFISADVDQTHPMPVRKQNASQLVLTKPLPSQRGQKMQLNMCWRKPLSWQRWHKMYLNFCWTNAFHACENTKRFKTCDQTHPMPARIKNVSQHVLTKPTPCQRWQKIFFDLFLSISTHASHDTKCIPTSVEQTPSHASEDREFISTCVYQSHPKPARTKCIAMCVDQTFTWQREF